MARCRRSRPCERSGRQRSLKALRNAHEADPTNLRFVEALASQLGAAGRSAEAEEILLAATRDGVNDQQAWLSLADYHERRDEAAKARDALAQGLRTMEEAPPALLAAYVDLLIRADDLDRAEELVDRFTSEPVMMHLLRGRLLLARGRPAEALAESPETAAGSLEKETSPTSGGNEHQQPGMEKLVPEPTPVSAEGMAVPPTRCMA